MDFKKIKLIDKSELELKDLVYCLLLHTNTIILKNSSNSSFKSFNIDDFNKEFIIIPDCVKTISESEYEEFKELFS